ncbi:MAG: protein-glutamate O-methyltransferase [Crocinitomicaceae bacterium]|nr:protein-glutamate O-methyltransferase [Crocinitomicaceae bacterium]
MQTLNVRKNMSVRGVDFRTREFPMTNVDFEYIANIANEKTGIQLGEHKKDMIYSRIVRRIRALELKTFAEYCSYLKNNKNAEMVDFINAITTNLTSFFREQHHFDYLEKTVVPELLIKNKVKKSIRIWSAGCSTGEEPYSISMTLDKALGDKKGWDVKVLATDLDTNVVSHGKAGVYVPDRLDGLAPRLVKKNFSAVSHPSGVGQAYNVSHHLRKYITFNRLNLLHEWPMKGPFDVIFCRNVVIYFNKDTQKILFDRYADILKPNGYLFIGHSETLHGVTNRFESLGQTMYRKKL